MDLNPITNVLKIGANGCPESNSDTDLQSDIVTVSGALGHSTVSTTSNIYCHLLENSQAKVSEAITNVLKISPNDGSASDSNAAETADKNETF
ncbi:integrase family protein [Eubacterium sp. CAG:115]|nr:integrase family protein [Eubacterium sp. CAG:115]